MQKIHYMCSLHVYLEHPHWNHTYFFLVTLTFLICSTLKGSFRLFILIYFVKHSFLTVNNWPILAALEGGNEVKLPCPRSYFNRSIIPSSMVSMLNTSREQLAGCYELHLCLNIYVLCIDNSCIYTYTCTRMDTHIRASNLAWRPDVGRGVILGFVVGIL